MSWSLNAIGKPAAVRKSVAESFKNAIESTKHIQEEQDSVRSAEALVYSQLDFAITNGVGAVKVEASGSSSRKSDADLPSYPASTQIKVEVQSLYGFCE